jgi:hypothetical protein
VGRIPQQRQHMGACRPNPCPRPDKALSKAALAIYKNPMNDGRDKMRSLPQTVMTKPKQLSSATAPLKLTTFEFQPNLQPRQFFFLWVYNQPLDHALVHTWFCKNYSCPYHHSYGS